MQLLDHLLRKVALAFMHKADQQTVSRRQTAQRAEFEAGARLARDRVADLVERNAEAQLGGNEGQRVARRLARQRRRAAQARVDLDDAVLLRVRVERVLDVALADYAQVPDDVDGRRAEHVVVGVVERLRRRNDDRVARVDAERVEVLQRRASAPRQASRALLDLPPCCRR